MLTTRRSRWNLVLGFVFSSFVCTAIFAQNQPQADLAKLNQSGYFINANQSSYQTNSVWVPYRKLMDQSAVFDRIVSQLESIICGTTQNRSVLLVGEPSDTWRYLYARLASKQNTPECTKTAHVEVDISKIEAGHSYVGEVDEYWQESILAPADRKNAVLYLSSLNQLVGLGSHSNDDNGIEAEYANNISSGRLRSVAFMNKYEYEFLARSKHAYVVNAFAVTIKLDEMTTQEINTLQQDYLRIVAPGFSLIPKEQDYLNKTAKFYLPNFLEPQRSITILKRLIQANGGEGAGQTEELDRSVEVASDLETIHPYAPKTKWERTILRPDALKISLMFDSFVTEASYDKLVIKNGDTGVQLASISGDKGAFETEAFATNHLKLEFTSDSGTEFDGFKVGKIIQLVKKPITAPTTIVFNREDIRVMIMKVAQLPEWIINRQYDTVRNLRSKLDGDVVGCHQAKDDAVKLAKIGYVGGRTDEKPVASHMFVGSTGTGKSYMAKKMADFLDIKLITFDMTSYRTPESFDRFIDSLSQSLILYPYAIYLFEEVDKADSKILDRLYFMTDEGVLYDKYQRPLFARGAYIIITTNAAEEAILSNPNSPTLTEDVNAELRKLFRPSFLNRMDAISIFKPFTQPEYRQLAEIMVKKKIKSSREIFDWAMTVDGPSLDYIAKNGQSARYGARPMERLIDSVIASGVAEWQLAHGPLFAENQVAIKKAQQVNDFICLSQDKQVNYSVDPDVNSGSKLISGYSPRSDFSEYLMMKTKIEEALEDQSIWSDRD